MRTREYYLPPTPQDTYPDWYVKLSNQQTKRNIAQLWAANGWKWAARNKVHAPVTHLYAEVNGTRLFWNGVVIAEHFEAHTTIYEGATPADVYVTAAATLARDVLINDANYTPVNMQKVCSSPDARTITCVEAAKRTPTANKASLELIRKWVAREFNTLGAVFADGSMLSIYNNALLYDLTIIARITNKGHGVAADSRLPAGQARYWAGVARVELNK